MAAFIAVVVAAKIAVPYSYEMPKRKSISGPLMRIHNDDISWNVSGSMGLWHEAKGDTFSLQFDAMMKRESGDWSLVPEVISLLDDPDRFVAAHFILAAYFPNDVLNTATMERSDELANEIDYLGLSVRLHNDGSESCKNTDIEKLKQMWWRIAVQHGVQPPLYRTNLEILANEPPLEGDKAPDIL